MYKCSICSQMEYRNKKVVLLYEHTLRDVYNICLLRYWWCVARSYASHTIMTFHSRCEFFLDSPVQNFYANVVVHWVQICVLEPQAWSNKHGCHPFQKSQMGDTDTEAMHAHWADTFRWNIKNSHQNLHMTGRCCSVRSMLW